MNLARVSPPLSCPFAEQLASENLGYASLDSLRLIGLSFRTADLALRGRVSFTGSRLEEFYNRAKSAGIPECLAICTCNRTEILVYGEHEAAVREILCNITGVDAEELDDHLYVKSGHLAARHIFRLCSGLESAVIGETDILAQVKEALAVAQDRKSIGSALNLLLRHAFAASKRVRTETELCRGVTSLASLAVKEAMRIVGDLATKSVVVIGAGRISERLIKELVLENPLRLTVANRTLSSAEILAERYGVECCNLSDLARELVAGDLVFTAVASAEPILKESDLRDVSRQREGREFTIVDLGVPANVTFAAKQLEGILSVDMDHLVGQCTRNAERREASIPEADEIIREELGEVAQAFSDREAAGAIQALVRRCEEIRRQNLGWALEKLGDLDDRQLKIVEDLTLRMTRGLLESPIRSLKGSSFDAEDRDVVLRLFEASEGDDS